MLRARRRNAATAVVVAVASLVAGCGSSGGSLRAAPGASVHWTRCAEADGPIGYQCATVLVPLDPRHPTGASIALAVDRAPATGARMGSLLVNPGGPGVSGVDQLGGLVDQLSPALRQHFDIVGFDPPGVGHSRPVECLDDQDLGAYLHTDPAPPAAALDAVVATDRTFGAACERRSGTILPHVSTVDAALDLDRVRIALGDARLSYLGFSYGTLLGATYAQLFPTHVRAMVLDGAIDPAVDPVTAGRAQAVAIDTEFRQFASACVAAAGCPWHPGVDPVRTYLALEDQLRHKPLPVRGTGRTIGPSELLYGTAQALYSTQLWPALQLALAQVTSGDGSLLLRLFDTYVERTPDGHYANTIEAEQAVNCLDAPVPTVEQIRALRPAFDSAAPVFGGLVLDSLAGCAVWPVPPTGQPHPVTAAGSPPIVVVGSTGDPVTPYAAAQNLASELQHGVLLTRVGEGHTGYGASRCVQARVDTYLLRTTPPPAGTRCPSS
ncbi:MAG: alpha/beta hydrolase [Acidimicrobiales bacterium]